MFTDDELIFEQVDFEVTYDKAKWGMFRKQLDICVRSLEAKSRLEV